MERMILRVNFQLKTLENKGNIINVGQIVDMAHYQEFFSKVDKGIFIGNQKF